MHSPGTTAVLEGPAGFEADVARAAAITRTGPSAAYAGTRPLPVPAARPAGAAPVPRPAELDVAAARDTASPVTMSGVPSGHGLPCMDDPELFFAESPQDVESAKALCRECPARIACLSGAVERSEPWGVWGGELFLRGEIVPRKRPRGRPRKTEVAA